MNTVQTLLRIMETKRLVAHTAEGRSFIPLLQGSMDGREWRDYEHRLMPTTEMSPPRFIAPLHVRWDQFMIYVGYGMDLAGLGATTFNCALPSNFSRHPPM